MVIPAEKGDSETDSSDLIICGPTQVCDREEILKKKNLKSMSNKWSQNKAHLCVYTAEC